MMEKKRTLKLRSNELGRSRRSSRKYWLMGEVDTSKDLGHCIQKRPMKEDFEQVRREKGKEPVVKKKL